MAISDEMLHIPSVPQLKTTKGPGSEHALKVHCKQLTRSSRLVADALYKPTGLANRECLSAIATGTKSVTASRALSQKIRNYVVTLTEQVEGTDAVMNLLGTEHCRSLINEPNAQIELINDRIRVINQVLQFREARKSTDTRPESGYSHMNCAEMIGILAECENEENDWEVTRQGRAEQAAKRRERREDGLRRRYEKACNCCELTSEPQKKKEKVKDAEPAVVGSKTVVDAGPAPLAVAKRMRSDWAFWIIIVVVCMYLLILVVLSDNWATPHWR